MKKLAVAVSVLAISAVNASAADMAPGVYSKVPKVGEPIVNWTGFYIGGSIGGRWSDDDWTTTGIGTTLFAPNPFSPTARFHPRGVRAGEFAGYNWQVSPAWVFGVEADAAWANNRSTIGGIPGTYTAATAAEARALDSIQVKEGPDASLRLRAGYLVTPSWLLYATGGVAFQQVSMTVNCQGTPINASACIDVRNETTSSTLFGWTAGAGAEVMLSSNWLLRGEYRYSDYGRLSHLFFAGNGGNQIQANVLYRTNTATIGIAYKFGGPIVAKY